MKRGLFITFEGPDGSGKSTQINYLKEYLTENNISVVQTREPGGTPIGEKIRAILLDESNSEMSPMCEMMLYAAARAQIVNEVIEPALQSGKFVICDRFVDSSIAYQSYGRNLGTSVAEVNKYAVADNMPDVTFLLMLDASEGMDRIDKNIGKRDRMEGEDMSFHNMVQRGYINLARTNPNRILMLDGTKPKEVIKKQIKERIDGLLYLWWNHD